MKKTCTIFGVWVKVHLSLLMKMAGFSLENGWIIIIVICVKYAVRRIQLRVIGKVKVVGCYKLINFMQTVFSFLGPPVRKSFLLEPAHKYHG